MRQHSIDRKLTKLIGKTVIAMAVAFAGMATTAQVQLTNPIDIESVTARLPGVPRHVLSPEPIQFSESVTNSPTITIGSTSRPNPLNVFL